MQEAIDAYGQTNKLAETPRDLEASVLLRAATQLQSIKDDWEANKGNLDEALLYNRKLWTIFATTVAESDNPLPLEIKNNIASLGVFIMNHTVTIQKDPKPEKLTTLININREIAAGLYSDTH